MKKLSLFFAFLFLIVIFSSYNFSATHGTGNSTTKKYTKEILKGNGILGLSIAEIIGLDKDAAETFNSAYDASWLYPWCGTLDVLKDGNDA